MSGPAVRTDLVHAYIFARANGALRHFQGRRVGGSLAGAWHPVMGGVRDGETAVEAGLREVREETGLEPREMLGAWTLESVSTFYMARSDAIFMSVQLAIEAPADWQPALNDEHDDWRWVPHESADAHFMWPGQLAALVEIERFIAQPSLARDHLRIRV